MKKKSSIIRERERGREREREREREGGREGGRERKQNFVKWIQPEGTIKLNSWHRVTSRSMLPCYQKNCNPYVKYTSQLTKACKYTENQNTTGHYTA